MVETFDCPNTSLQRKDKGEKVKLLQTHLKTLGYYTTVNGHYLKLDGDYGIYTEDAVKAFQRKTGHDPDGWFGPLTCPDLNKKIQEHYGIATTNPPTTTTATTTKAPTKTMGKYVNPWAIDTKKNVFSVEEANVIIQGINIVATSITPNTGFPNGNWNSLKMTDGSNYTYKTSRELRKYTIETFMRHEEYDQLKSEFYKMGEQVCEVYSPIIAATYFTVHVDMALESVEERKVTFTLTQFEQ